MAQRRSGGSIRGTRVGTGPARAASGSRAGSRTKPDVEIDAAPRQPIANPEKPREVIDHSLARKAAINDILRTGGFNSDACDADPYLLRAAKWHGEHTGRPCPICRQPDREVVDLTYVYSKELGAFSGRIYAAEDVPGLARQHGILRVFVVEVCQACHWNHVVHAYVVGDGIPRRPRRRPSDLLD